MPTPHRFVNVVGRIALTGTAALATMTLAACGSSPSTVWIADDLERAGGRHYVTCEAQHDPDNDNLEIQVWVIDAQARHHRKGAPCPNGTVRHAGSDVTGYTVGKPLRPTQPTTTSSSKPAGPTTARPSTKTTPQSSAPKTAGKPSATNKPPAPQSQGPARQGPKPVAPKP